MRRRLDLTGALVAEPPVLFLDAPPTGLGPRSRTELWSAIRELMARGSTLLLTSHLSEHENASPTSTEHDEETSTKRLVATKEAA
jgi:ABC-type multidrug transport system ATPase subunit